MPHTVEGKIAKILDDRHVVINLGAMQGVKMGTVFSIIAQGDEVKDPDTGEVLGQWEIPKGFVIATHVQDRLATCESYQMREAEEEDEDPTTRVLSADMTNLAMRAHAMAGRQTKLTVNPRDISGMPRIGPIGVGDKVRAQMDFSDTSTDESC